ncbi:hypothetical protein DSO57_1021324 [Entomophthora muscae]|uniref:Uncharacterized protein n=2 Tax=Entomophthora muscae TaxID=34485 RepID=A0ACC2T3L0_9FUNG|nr:hypothetical protein DSO57_1021324 [Entomophthora muscae]
MNNLDLFGDNQPKRRKVDEADYQRFKAQFIVIKEKLFNKLGNDQGRQTLQENLNYFGHEDSIAIIRESNLPDSDVIRLGIPLCEGLGVPASKMYFLLVTCCIDEIVEAMYKGAPENHKRLADLMPILDDFVGTRFFNRITLAALDILPKPDILTQYYPILNDEEAMEVCPLRIKQLLWKDNPLKFKQLVFPLISRYVSDTQIEEQSCEINSPIIPLKLKARQEHPALLELVDLVGNQVELYNYVADALAGMYSQHGSVVYCNMRFDLLMAFHRRKIPQIYNSDPIYSFVWCLDAAILKNSHFKERIPSLFQELHKWQPKFNDSNHAALGMVLRASFAMDWLARQAFNFIRSTNTPLSELKLVFDLMEIGFSSRLTAKYGVRVRLSNDIPVAISEMATYLRDLTAKVPYHKSLAGENRWNILESMNTATDCNVYFTLRKGVYIAAKCNAIACALMNQFVLDRFKDKDYVSTSILLSVLRQLIQKAETERQEVVSVWSKDFAPGFIFDKPKRTNMSFSHTQGIIDPYLPLFRSILMIHYQQPERSFELLSSQTALQVMVWKFLVPLALVHAPTHRAVLDLVIHIQKLIVEDKSSSVQHYSKAIIVLGEIVESLLSNWGSGMDPLPVNPLMFADIYRKIANSMSILGPNFCFGINNAPITMKFLEYISSHQLA